MMYKVARLVLLVAIGACFSTSAFAVTPAPCNASFTACSIIENELLQLPFIAIAGDVVVRDPGAATVSDLFRIFNNVVDTGSGTGLGNMAFLYSVDDSALPDPSTYSANVSFIDEAATTDTTVLLNGTLYTLDTLAVPEPSTFLLLSLAVLAMLLIARPGVLRISAFLSFTRGRRGGSFWPAGLPRERHVLSTDGASRTPRATGRCRTP